MAGSFYLDKVHPDDRLETVHHESAIKSDLHGGSRWTCGLGLSVTMTPVTQTGSGMPRSRSLGPVHSAPRGRVLNARAPLSHLDRVDCPAIPSLLAHADH